MYIIQNQCMYNEITNIGFYSKYWECVIYFLKIRNKSWMCPLMSLHLLQIISAKHDR